MLTRLRETYESEKCEHCGQSLTYILPIDRGTVEIVRAIAKTIFRKGINVVHPRKEMEVNPHNISVEIRNQEGYLTSNEVGNLSRPRFHGLIAKIKENPGNYCLTTKGAKFLKGESVPRFAIISKAEGHQIGYWRPEIYQCTIKDFISQGEYWEGINFDIIEGRIVKDLPPTGQEAMV